MGKKCTVVIHVKSGSSHHLVITAYQDSLSQACFFVSNGAGPEKGAITKGLFSSLESLKPLSSLESLESGPILLCFPPSWGSLESL